MTNIQFPLMIAGKGNTHKTTIALETAYREYLTYREKYGNTNCKILVLSTEMGCIEDVFNIFSRNILGSTVDVHSEFTDKNIEIKLNESIDYLNDLGSETVKFLIIDDLYVFVESGSPNYGPTGITERMEDVNSQCQDHGIKMIAVAHAVGPRLSHVVTPIRDHGTKHLFNRFILTSDVGLETKISSLGNITPYTKDIFKGKW